MTKDKEYIEEAIYVTCRSCGCEYLEQKDWFTQNNRTICPLCKTILEMK